MAGRPLHKSLLQCRARIAAGLCHSRVSLEPAFALALLFSLAIPLSSAAQSLPAGEEQKIETLIERVSSLKDAVFIRNESSYSADKAATFLRRKWQANRSAVTSARDFVEKIASFSGTSGRPYLIRFKDGKELQSKDFLLAELRKIDSDPANQKPQPGKAD